MWWKREKKEVAEFLYGLLVSDAPRGFAREVAEKMQVPYPTLSKYWQGKRRFPATLVKPLFLATDEDPRVAEFFVLEGSSYRLQRRAETGPPDDVALALIKLGELHGQVSADYLRSLSVDEEANQAARHSALEHLDAIRSHVESLSQAFR